MTRMIVPPPLSTTDYSKHDLRVYCREAFRKVFRKGEISDQGLRALTQKRIVSIRKDEGFNQAILAIAYHFKKICLEMNTELGVLSLSKLPLDIIMWSHYGDNHRGIVLEFDKSRLQSDSNYPYCEPVDYDNNVMTLRDMNTKKSEELARLILLRKAGQWRYEKEWKIIVDPTLRQDIRNCRTYKFPKLALTGVIFGCQMTSQDKYAVHTWLKAGNHEARIYQAIRDNSSYTLRTDPPLSS